MKVTFSCAVVYGACMIFMSAQRGLLLNVHFTNSPKLVHWLQIDRLHQHTPKKSDKTRLSNLKRTCMQPMNSLRAFGKCTFSSRPG